MNFVHSLKVSDVRSSNSDDLTTPAWVETFTILANTIRNFNTSRVENKENAMVMKTIFYDIQGMALRSIMEYAQMPTVKDLAFEISIAASKLRDMADEKGAKVSFFARRDIKEVKNIITFVEGHLTDAAVSLRRYEGVFPGSNEEQELKKRNKLIV